MNHFIIGNYVPGSSGIYRMMPASKLGLNFFLVIVILFANDWFDYLWLWITVLISVIGLGLPLVYIYKGIRPLLLIILFAMLLQMLFGAGGDPLFKWGPISITRLSVVNSVFVAFRFLLIIMTSTVLTLSTSPAEISAGFADLLKPLSIFKAPVDLVSLLLSVSLRFISILADEFSVILKAQRVRGINFAEGTFFQRARKLINLLVPILYRAFQYAQQLSDAMISRGYSDRRPRSRYRTYSWQIYDTVGWLLYLLTGILVLCFRK